MSDDFIKRKDEVLRPIFLEVGWALFSCQGFEYGMAYLLHLLSKLGIPNLNINTTIRILDDDEKKTAGQLIGLLKKHISVPDEVSMVLTEALTARNKLIHRYLVENVERFHLVNEHEAIVNEIRQLRETVKRADAMLKSLAFQLMPVVEHCSPHEEIAAIKEMFMASTMKNSGL